MKSTFYRFKISEVIKTYKQKIRDEILKNEEEIDTTNKALYEKLLLEITTKDKYVSKTGVEYNKEVYINLNPLISDLIAKQGIEDGFVICTSDHTTASVFISHFDKENITYLSKSLKKSNNGSKVPSHALATRPQRALSSAAGTCDKSL